MVPAFVVHDSRYKGQVEEGRQCLFASRRMMKVVVAVACLAVVGAACSKKDNTSNPPSSGAASTKTVKIAFMGDLSGPNKQLVASPYQASQLAFEQFNASQKLIKVVEVG